jgi:hypothetical protein
MAVAAVRPFQKKDVAQPAARVAGGSIALARAALACRTRPQPRPSSRPGVTSRIRKGRASSTSRE